jgi:hypothetical protein
MEEFDALPIDRGYISEIQISPNKVISLKVMVGPFDSVSSVTGKAVRVYEIKFEPLHGFSFSAHADPWLEIISHEGPMDKSAEGGASHFKIICQEGTLDIFAGACEFSLVEEICFVERH